MDDSGSEVEDVLADTRAGRLLRTLSSASRAGAGGGNHPSGTRRRHLPATATPARRAKMLVDDVQDDDDGVGLSSQACLHARCLVFGRGANNSRDVRRSSM